MTVLHIHGVHAGWDAQDTLAGVDLAVDAGERVAVFGGNGAGKSTLLAVLAGALRPRRGQITLDGRRIDRWPTHRIARAGLRLLPQTHRIFASMTVAENLAAAEQGAPADTVRTSRARWLARFPVLHDLSDRPAADLSGGQQQLLAIVRVLSTRPRVLLLDEPFAGLSTDTAIDIAAALTELGDTAVVLVEQQHELAERITTRTLNLHGGRLHEEARHEG